ncbi:Phosphatidate cytidylyltransferase (CDP-diacylglycerol synthase) [Bradyrhizobium sp. STM 3843]|uniref:phosphatidate cytidylyltransferase n=1 Tax=Bradyrhizobium sp. STM 3843 TaxID=551947 RepID=UPI000240AE4D|nr:phosphatidate cytidylyltransferase [Bradyrhizobium sp. STM 3843]CCE05336.1 Phosphatidate cytidylyltransferase (CDP-diacylglycerol synthase) [Bradyrhizobium sp. STM 3843]
MSKTDTASAADAAKGAQPNKGAQHNLLMRVAAAVVLIPLALGAAYAGGVFWTALVTVAAVGLYVEWLMVVGEVRAVGVTVTGALLLAISGVCLALGLVDFAVVVLGLGLVVVVMLAAGHRSWAAAGFVYTAAAQLASVLVRLDYDHGWFALVLVLLVVWASDIGGYVAGRGLGGPKLAPRISPNKTWAGAIGGFVGSLVVAAGWAASGAGNLGPLLAVAAVLSVVSQLGDLFESAVKRHFGVKDSSHIIPGHGGLLDRLDGYVAAIVFAAILGLVRGGLDGVGRGLLMW